MAAAHPEEQSRTQIIENKMKKSYIIGFDSSSKLTTVFDTDARRKLCWFVASLHVTCNNEREKRFIASDDSKSLFMYNLSEEKYFTCESMEVIVQMMKLDNGTMVCNRDKNTVHITDAEFGIIASI